MISSKTYTEHIVVPAIQPFWEALRDGGEADVGSSITSVDMCGGHALDCSRLNPSVPILMEDGAPGHMAKATQAVHEEYGIPKLVWPAQSPDLNPIENVWSVIKTRVNSIKPRPTEKDDVKAAVIQVWDALGSKYIQKLVDSMPERLKAVREANGGHTRW